MKDKILQAAVWTDAVVKAIIEALVAACSHINPWPSPRGCC